MHANGASGQHVVDEAIRKTRFGDSKLDFPLRPDFKYDVRFAIAREEPVRRVGV